jgi:hypothetical protein
MAQNRGERKFQMFYEPGIIYLRESSLLASLLGSWLTESIPGTTVRDCMHGYYWVEKVRTGHGRLGAGAGSGGNNMSGARLFCLLCMSS